MLKKTHILLGTMASFCGIYTFCYIYCLETIGKLSPMIILLLLVVLTLGLVIMVELVYPFKKKPNLKNYTQINPPGLMKHKKTGKYYCQPCLIKKHILSEVSITNTKEWICRCCKETYKVNFNEFLLCKSFFSRLTDALTEVVPNNNKV